MIRSVTLSCATGRVDVEVCIGYNVTEKYRGVPLRIAEDLAAWVQDHSYPYVHGGSIYPRTYGWIWVRNWRQ